MKTRFISLLVLAATLLASVCTAAPAAASRVTAADLTAEELSCDEYDVRKYVTPFWQTNVIWNECFFPLIGNDGKRRPIKLMYKADEIVSVHDYTLTKEYKKGIDYDLNEDGEFVFLSRNGIPKVNDSFIHPATMPTDASESNYYPRRDGAGYEYWNESSELSLKTVAITYVTSDENEPERPESIAASIPRSFEKLARGEDFHFVLLGDSVGTGAKSSGNCGVPPYADAYPKMTEKALSLKFGNENVRLTNNAIGGTTSEYTEKRLEDTVIKYAPDLVVINFGMNDSSYERVGYTDERFRTNMIGQIEYIRSKLPDTEILLLSSLIGNPYTFDESRYVSHAAILHELAAEYDGVACVDPQAIERFYLQRKQFVDFMADNMVHPNDLGMRLIAMTIVDAFRFEDLSDFVAIEMEKLTAEAKLAENAENGRYALLTAALDEARIEMNAQSDEWGVTEAYEAYSQRIATILRQCAPEDHVLETRVRPARCDADGSYYDFCAVCGYECDTEAIPALGGSHLWDSGFVSIPSGYRAKGTRTYTCMRCGQTRAEAIPELSDGARNIENSAMLHVVKGYNYMESSHRPYIYGDGTVELDVCPLDTNMGRDGVAYAGIWFANYTICAAYNFSNQRFEIVDANLPRSFSGGEFKVVKYEWRSLAECGSLNWHKLAFNVQGSTVRIWCDGELVLEDENERYASRTQNNVALFYSIGEFYLDNWKVSRGGYDPASGEGETLLDCDLDSAESRSEFSRRWGYGNYTTLEMVIATERTLSTAVYADHEHTPVLVGEVSPGCANEGGTVYECAECGARFVGEVTPDAGGHAFILTGVRKDGNGMRVREYECAYCDMTFGETVETPSPRLALFGDVNADSRVNARDAIAIMLALVGQPDVAFDADRADVTRDGTVNARDAVALMRALVGRKLER